MASFVKSWEGSSKSIGGLFGAPIGGHEQVIPWSRQQQAALLIVLWNGVKTAVATGELEWASSLRLGAAAADEHGIGLSSETEVQHEDAAFYGSFSLLSSDQGIRGVLQVANDLLYVRANALGLFGWEIDSAGAATDEDAVSEAIANFEADPRIAGFVDKLGEAFAKFDWRTSSFPELSIEEQRLKAAYRGSGGYALLRADLLQLVSLEAGEIGSAAVEVRQRLAN
jgi:hypothetical protein